MSAGRVQEQAGQMLQSAREQATSQLSTQKERAVGTLGTLASVLHDAGRQARERDEATVGQYIDVVADQIDSFGNALREQDLNQLLTNTGQFARRQPALFLAAAFAAGFAAARLLKSASPQQGAGQRDMAAIGAMSDRSGASGYRSGFTEGTESGSATAGGRSIPSQPADTLLGSEWTAPGGASLED